MSQNTSWEQAGVPDNKKGMYVSMQNSVGQRKERKKGRVSRTGPAPGRWKNWSRDQIPTLQQVQQLIYDSLNEMKNTQTTLATALHILDRDASALEHMAAGAGP